jgi:hypothetical protein
LKKDPILISGHYDHNGLSKTAVNGDFINNGANDDLALQRSRNGKVFQCY